MKNESNHNLTSDQIEAEASAWIVQLDGENISVRDIDAFKEWAQRSPAHLEAAKVAAKIWSYADDLNQLFPAIEAEKKLSLTQQRRLEKRGVFSLLGASLVAMLAVAWCVSVFDLTYPQEVVAQFEEPLMLQTKLGNQLENTLPDQSTIKLNTDTQIEVEFTRHIRRVRVLHGEALFDVAHDPTRPFVVYAQDEAVRAIGTEFIVKVHDRAVDLIVTEGVVEYTPAKLLASKPSEPFQLALESTGRVVAGQAVRLSTPAPLVQPISKTDLRKTLAWTDGMLIFSGETLEEVIHELSRYTDDRIIFKDDRASQIKVGGVFEIGDMDSLWEALETSFNIHVEITPDQTVLLSMLSDN